MGKVTEHLSNRPENGEEVVDVISKDHSILDCKNWVTNEKKLQAALFLRYIRDLQFDFKEAVVKVSIRDFLEQWYNLGEYSRKIISLARVLYLVTLYKIMTAPISKN